MKKILTGLTLILIGLLIMAPGASAYPVAVGDYIKFVDGPGSGSGGSFGVKVKNGTYPTSPDFYSFCLEGGEHIDFSSVFYVYDISGTAHDGGMGPVGDPLNPETAFLYTRFASGNIINNDVNSTALQIAIWAFENEMGYSISGNDIYKSGVVISNTLAQTYADNAISADWDGIGNVRVLNIRYNGPEGKLAQSQLTYVPEPATLCLLFVGLFGLAAINRRKK